MQRIINFIVGVFMTLFFIVACGLVSGVGGGILLALFGPFILLVLLLVIAKAAGI